MKVLSKITAVAFVCTLFAGGASALDMSLGIKGGVNLSKPIGVDETMKDYLKIKAGMILGVSYELKVTDMFSIQPEALFAQKGMKMEISEDFMGESFNATSVINFNYIEIPVLFKINLPVEAIGPNLYVGPAIAFRAGIGGYAESEGEKIDMDAETITAAEESTNAVDFGLAFGGGLAIPAGPGAVIVDVRYTLGLLNIDKEDEETGKNGGLALMAGYSFPIGGN